MPQVVNMSTFFNSLGSEIKKADLKIDIGYNFEELSQVIGPMYDLASVPELTGNAVKATELHFRKEINTYKDSPYKTIAAAITILADNEELLIDLINKEFNDVTPNVLLDYYQLNILKYVQDVAFFNDYARMWMNAAVWETVDKREINNPTLRRDAEFVSNVDNILAFAEAVNMLALPFHKFLDSIKILKGHTYNEEDWQGSHNIVNAKLDPYRSNHAVVMKTVGYLSKLFYIGGMVYNSYRIKRHEQNKAELARLQLMLLDLDKRKTANADPERDAVLEKQINYYSNLSNKISAQIEALEGHN